MEHINSIEEQRQELIGKIADFLKKQNPNNFEREWQERIQPFMEQLPLEELQKACMPITTCENVHKVCASLKQPQVVDKLKEAYIANAALVFRNIVYRNERDIYRQRDIFSSVLVIICGIFGGVWMIYEFMHNVECYK